MQVNAPPIEQGARTFDKKLLFCLHDIIQQGGSRLAVASLNVCNYPAGAEKKHCLKECETLHCSGRQGEDSRRWHWRWRHEYMGNDSSTGCFSRLDLGRGQA